VHRDTTPVRAGEELDLAALADFLRGKIEGVDRGIAVEQFPSEHSNLTYLLRVDDSEYVLRRGPMGPAAGDLCRYEIRFQGNIRFFKG